MSSVLCHCTVSYCVYFGVYHKEMAIMKVSHKMGFRDSQSRDKLWYSATHFILQQETPSYENLSGICSCAVCVVLDKVLSRGHSFAWHSLYQYSFLLNVPHCIWRKNYCGTSGSMNHLESPRIISVRFETWFHFMLPTCSNQFHLFSAQLYSSSQFHSCSVHVYIIIR
jgi:hypothetical protein